MDMRRRLRNHFVDGPDSLGERSRQARSEVFVSTFPDLESMHVVDLGGTASFWLRSPVRPARVRLVNVYPTSEAGELPKWIDETVADACDLPNDVRGLDIDLVYSNSVIEHVGGHARRILFADAVHSLARRHWVQTPYRYFPVEPHWVCPGLQFLPLWLRARIAMNWPLAHSRTNDVQAAIRTQLGVELLDVTGFGSYFPNSEIQRERIAGMTKSLIAIST